MDTQGESARQSEDADQEFAALSESEAAQALEELSEPRRAKAAKTGTAKAPRAAAAASEVRDKAPNSSEDESTDAPNVDKPEVKKNVGFLYALVLSVLNFFLPLYETVKGFHPCIEKVMTYIESVAKRLENFFQKYDRIWDIKFADLLELMKAAYEEVKSFFTGYDTSFQLLFRSWYETHVSILKSLRDVERIQEYIVPVIDGVEPLYVIDRRKKYAIRELCYYMNMNLIHRIFLRTCGFFSDLLGWSAKSSKSDASQSKESEYSTPEKGVVNVKKEGTSAFRRLP